MNKKSLKFHIESQDYFGTLATILSLIRQTINVEDFSNTNLKILKKIEVDLNILQKNYKIIKK